MSSSDAPLGATWLGEGRCHFRVWAPDHRRVALHLLEPDERLEPLAPGARGYHEAVLDGVSPGALYRYRLDDEGEWADPASRHQPRGVHGPSRVVDPAFEWDDGGFRPPATPDLVLYELHVGTFTSEGTFDAAVAHLDALCDLGITALELMPVAQFPGERNWGYDGAFPWAVHHGYGGPDGLRHLVRACHRRGLAVHLDVVYNHLGPEGCPLPAFAPYLTDTYRTPWGPALNFDGAGSDEVRAHFLANALHWIREYHLDGLRLDAIHAIHDRSAVPFLEELVTSIAQAAPRVTLSPAAAFRPSPATGSPRPVTVIGETHDNDARLVHAPERGGTGLDAIWCDDLHHALHALLTGESVGYYADYGRMADLERVWRDHFAYAERYSSWRGHTYGRSGRDLPADRFVAFVQNHDQIGNRPGGDRLGTLVTPAAERLAAAMLLLSPWIPLLFMGEEYGETAPFPYFVHHGDPRLVEAVRRGRAEGLRHFGWRSEAPDPQAEATFRSARLDRTLAEQSGHRGLLALHRELLGLRREHPALASRARDDLHSDRDDDAHLLRVTRRAGDARCLLLFHLSDEAGSVPASLEDPSWRRVLSTADVRWDGPGSSVPELAAGGTPLMLELGPYEAVMLERA